MDRGGISLTRRSTLFLLAGLMVYALFLYFFVDVGDLRAAIQQVDPWCYSLAFATAIAYVAFQSLAWRGLLESLSIGTSFWKAFSYTWVGMLVDIMVPAESVSGEVAKTYLMSRNSDGDTGRVTASTVIHRFIYTALSLGGLILGSTIFALNQGATQTVQALIIVMVTGSTASLAILVLSFIKRSFALRIIESLLDLLNSILKGRWHLEGLKPRAQRALDAFYQGLKTLGERPRNLVCPTVSSAAAWVSKLMITFLVLASTGINLPISAIIVVFSLTDALQTIPLGIPGEVGVVEIAMTSLYTAIGVPPTISATTTILTRSVTTWFTLLIGGVMVHWIGGKAISP